MVESPNVEVIRALKELADPTLQVSTVGAVVTPADAVLLIVPADKRLGNRSVHPKQGCRLVIHPG